MEIKLSEIPKHPKEVVHRAHNKTFLIKRKLFADDFRTVNLTYWIYEKKKFLSFDYDSCLSGGAFRLSFNTIKEARNFLNEEYCFMKEINFHDSDYF